MKWFRSRSRIGLLGVLYETVSLISSRMSVWWRESERSLLAKHPNCPNSSGLPKMEAPHSKIRIGHLLLVAVELALACLVLIRFELDLAGSLMWNLMWIVPVFIAHALMPLSWRRGFVLAVTAVLLWKILGVTAVACHRYRADVDWACPPPRGLPVAGAGHRRGGRGPRNRKKGPNKGEGGGSEAAPAPP